MEIYKEKEVVWAVVDTGWYAMYKITSPWNAVGCNWNRPWKIPGGDFDATVSSDTVHYIDQGLGWQRYTITKLAQGFIASPSTNYGLIVDVAMDDPTPNFLATGRDTVYQASTYASAASTTQANRPRVTITYTTDPAEIGGQIHGSGDAPAHLAVQGRSFRLFGGMAAQQYRVRIMDLQGRVIMAMGSCEKLKVYPVPQSVPRGVYLFRIDGNNQNCIQKIIVH